LPAIRPVRGRATTALRRLVRENALSLALLACFAVSLAGQVFSGFAEDREQRRQHGGSPITLSRYLGSAHFFEAIFENWESEFLQMGAFVLMTIALKQRGSSESKPLEGKAPEKVPARLPAGAPWPVRRGGLALRLYRHSLTLALLLLFALCFAGHALAGSAEENQDRARHGGGRITPIAYVGTARFWFESFQNWQSEFLSMGVLIVLSIFLRQEGSPQSKKIWEPNAKTGTDG